MRRFRTIAGIVIVAGLALLPVAYRPLLNHRQGDASTSTKTEKESVLILGASVAEGWDDKTGGGYLVRAFKTLSGVSSTQYVVHNEAHAGDGVMQVVNSYPKWLSTYKPQIVVISWGALDDLHMGTPLSKVEAQVRWEAELALGQHAVVFLVTPPVTRASYVGKLAPLEAPYVNHEIAAIRSLHNSNAYVFNVFHQMKAYLVAHHQTITPYVGDGWHPNTAGHILAGNLLSNDVEKVFGHSPIAFQ